MFGRYLFITALIIFAFVFFSAILADIFKDLKIKEYEEQLLEKQIKMEAMNKRVNCYKQDK